MLVGRNVDKCLRAKNSEAGDIRFIATPGFFRCLICKCMGRGDIMDVDCILKSVEPVGFWEISIE